MYLIPMSAFFISGSSPSLGVIRLGLNGGSSLLITLKLLSEAKDFFQSVSKELL